MRVTAAGRSVRAVFAAVAIALSASAVSAAPKIDVLELENGDRRCRAPP